MGVFKRGMRRVLYGRQCMGNVSGPIKKKSSSTSEDSSSETMEVNENASGTDAHLEQELKRLREEERVLLEKQAIMEAGNDDDFAALENQDALRLNQLQQRDLEKKVARLALRQAQAQALPQMQDLAQALPQMQDLAQALPQMQELVLALPQMQDLAQALPLMQDQAQALPLMQDQAQALPLMQDQAQALPEAQAQGSHGARPRRQLSRYELPRHEPLRREPLRRRAECTVRVNNLHAGEALETDV